VITRRDFLKLGGGLVAVSSAPIAGCAGDETLAPIDDTTLLHVTFADLQLGSYRVRARTYGGGIPGPAITTKPGATLRVRVKNDLPPYDSSAWAKLPEGAYKMNVPHHLNTTNLHVHGLEVVPHLFEPVGTSDPKAMMIAIEPGKEKLYTFQLPDDHPTGLYWYHPHHHGSTAIQVLNGMAGIILVKGAIDEVPEIAAAKDYVIAIQDLGLFESTTDPGLWTYDPPQNAIWDTFGGTSSFKDADGNDLGPASSGFSTGDYPLRLYLANGSPIFEETHNSASPQSPNGTQLSVPRYTMAPGEVARFRVLNGTSDDMMPIVVEQHTMYLIALDGVNFLAPRPQPYVEGAMDGQEQVLLPSGGRAEFLLQAIATPGVYAVTALAQSQQFLMSAAKTLFEIEIAGDPVSMALPTTLPTPTRHYPLIEPSEISVQRTVTFDMMFPPAENKLVGLDFGINGALYDEEAVPFQPKLGAAEEWTITDNSTTTGGSMEGHPFHLHTNSFEVISVGETTLEPGTIQDTVWVPHATKVVIRVRFQEWKGKDVFHCHIIPHEDAGMMQNLLITG